MSVQNNHGLVRCAWAEGGDALMLAYHDDEWGVPVRDERKLFEMLTLEGAQAGLSWSTILRRREGYRAAFAGWDVAAIAAFDDDDAARLLADPGIIRNRAKVAATIDNARATLRLHEEGSSLTELLWRAVDNEPAINRWQSLGELPAETVESKSLSKSLRARGFRFVGPTICYALMQACGLVNDHQVDCFRWEPLARPA